MGVYGLAKYVEGCESTLLTNIELTNTRVIIDGNGLLYHLYFQNNNNRLDYRCGGQYSQFHDRIVTFFRSLEQNGVEPFVLLDGVPDPSGNKSETSRERLQCKIRSASSFEPEADILPLLAQETFMQTIRNIDGVRLAVCDL